MNQSIYLSGCASTTPAMQLYAKQAASRSHQNGWTLYIGSHHRGIDETLNTYCAEASIPFGVVTLQGLANPKENLEQYIARSKPAIDLTDMSMFIGRSSAVDTLIEYAKQIGKLVYVVEFSGDHTNITTFKPPEEKPLEQMSMFAYGT